MRDEFKQQAAHQAIEYVESGMVLGLGTGTTADFALERLAELLRDGHLDDLACIPSSTRTEDRAISLGIPITTFADYQYVDLTIDGADEVDPDLNLIKGYGGALLREKIIARGSRRVIIIVDDSKLSPVLGTLRPVPVEVVPFGWRSQAAYLESLGARAILRRNSDGTPLKTDQGNLILDCHFGPISQPDQLAAQMSERAGIVEHGLLLGLATDVIVASDQGIRHLKRES